MCFIARREERKEDELVKWNRNWFSQPPENWTLNSNQLFSWSTFLKDVLWSSLVTQEEVGLQIEVKFFLVSRDLVIDGLPE